MLMAKAKQNIKSFLYTLKYTLKKCNFKDEKDKKYHIVITYCYQTVIIYVCRFGKIRICSSTNVKQSRKLEETLWRWSDYSENNIYGDMERKCETS